MNAANPLYPCCTPECCIPDMVVVGKDATTGVILRPASHGKDWATQLAGLLSIGDRELRCKACLVPGRGGDGVPTLRISTAMRNCSNKAHTDTYLQVVDFILNNNLVVEGIPPHHSPEPTVPDFVLGHDEP